MIEGSSVVDMVRASNELRECLATLGCHALDASIVAKQPQGLEAYVNQCTADGVISALCCCASELRNACERQAISPEAAALLDMLQAIGMDIPAKLAQDALATTDGDSQAALNWILEHQSAGAERSVGFAKLFSGCDAVNSRRLRLFLATELQSGRWTLAGEAFAVAQQLPIFERYSDPLSDPPDIAEGAAPPTCVDMQSKYWLPPVGLSFPFAVGTNGRPCNSAKSLPDFRSLKTYRSASKA